jgi:hypothetical protein
MSLFIGQHLREKNILMGTDRNVVLLLPNAEMQELRRLVCKYTIYFHMHLSGSECYMNVNTLWTEGA